MREREREILLDLGPFTEAFHNIKIMQIVHFGPLN
jgi:hypothetical protein